MAISFFGIRLAFLALTSYSGGMDSKDPLPEHFEAKVARLDEHLEAKVTRLDEDFEADLAENKRLEAENKRLKQENSALKSLILDGLSSSPGTCNNSLDAATKKKIDQLWRQAEDAIRFKGRVKEAVACVMKVIKLDPKQFKAHRFLGHLYSNL